MNLRTPVAPDDLAAVRAWFDALATHPHLSLNRGTPERSYGEFSGS